MSTILKSLKKLEQENRSAQSEGPFTAYRGPGSLTTQGVKGRWIKSVWFKRGIVAALILGLGSASVYFYSQSRDVNKLQAKLDSQVRSRPKASPEKTIPRKPRKTPPPETDEIVPGIKRMTPRPVPSPVNKSTGAKRKTSTAPTTRRSAPPIAKNKPEGETTSAVGRSRKPMISENNSSSNQGIAQRRAQPERPPSGNTSSSTARTPATRAPATDRVPPKAIPKQPEKPTTESFDNVPVLSGGPLKVHAIVWSLVKEDRMAVVNSRVLHEGDAVEGYTLVAIRPDDVVVKKDGGRQYRVIFGRP